LETGIFVFINGKLFFSFFKRETFLLAQQFFGQGLALGRQTDFFDKQFMLGLLAKADQEALVNQPINTFGNYLNLA
jgi:hypothetical protein